jgi:nucleotide-binding universal stress UspA family protein
VVRGSKPAGAPVVVGADDSETAQLAVAFAFDQAAVRRAPLHLIRAVAPAAASWSARPDITEAVTAGERRSLTDQIAVWQDKYPQVQASCDVVVDHPARALSQAGETAQLVVVGSHGRGAFRGMMLGSVSQHVLRHCACTVAVVREAQHA